MPVIHWDKRFSIGIDQIDEHHQHFFYLLKNFYDNCIGKARDSELCTLYNELIDYATYHFAAEECWMQEHNYPGLAMHKKEHEALSATLVEMHREYHHHNRHLLMEILVFLHDWLQKHILKIDAEFGIFIADRNNRQLRVDENKN